jgi:hypothetical protein
MQATIEIEGRKYECIVTVERGERAPRENGQALWPNTNDFIIDLQAIAYTPRGTELVTSERIINRLTREAEQLI